MNAEASAIAQEVLNRLDTAWNAADGPGFASAFTDDVDVVNIFGMHIRGRRASADRMQHIFDTVFKGSRHGQRELEEARFLAPGVVLAISSATVEIPTGPMAPAMSNRQTASS
jgi:uncharacterized protein (TIGR02246 family)